MTVLTNNGTGTFTRSSLPGVGQAFHLLGDNSTRNFGFSHGLGFALALLFPVPYESIRRTRQPLWIIPKFRPCHGGKIIRCVPRRMAQRFQKACAYDDRNGMLSEAEIPPGFLHLEACW